MAGKKRQRLEQCSNKNKDRISDLPVQIMHQILSFLPPNEAVMTTFLSRAWRDVWIGLPSLNLGKTLFHQTQQNTMFGTLPDWPNINLPNQLKWQFFNFVDQTLMKRSEESYTKLASLNLYVADLPFKRRILFSRSDSLVNLVINDLKVEELIFHYEGKFQYKFVINPYLPTLPLKRLELHGVKLGHELIECLSRHCPLMERLCFHHCHTLDKVTKISGFRKLVEFVLHTENKDSSKLEIIDASNLCFLEYDNIVAKECNELVADTCLSRLRDLRLCGVVLTSPWLHSPLSNLDLKMCYIDTGDDGILGNSLKTLCIDNCNFSAPGKRKIEAQTLKYFTFKGPEAPPLFKLNHSGLEKALVSTDHPPGVSFLAQINPCEELTIRSHSVDQVLNIGPGWTRKVHSPLLDFKHLKLEIYKIWLSDKGPSMSDLVDTLLWLSPCALTFTISLYKDRRYTVEEFKVIKFKYYEEGNKGAKKCRRCRLLPVRCWQHNLDQVIIENHRADGKESAYPRKRKMRAEDDNNLKAFFESARQKNKIIVNIIS